MLLYSVLNRSPPDLIEEIMLVDDFSKDRKFKIKVAIYDNTYLLTNLYLLTVCSHG